MKKKWLLFPALLLAIAGLVMIGCRNSTSPVTPPVEPPTGGVGEGFFELGTPDAAWWYSNGCDDKVTSLTFATLKGAKYLIMKVTSKANEDGFGGIQLAVQSDGDGWDWNETTRRRITPCLPVTMNPCT